MARYELLTQEPHRYVDVSVDGKVISMITGIVGVAGKSIEKSYQTSDEAWKEYQLFVRQLLERGYVASNNPREERETEEDPEEKAASSSDPALEAAIEADPANPAPYLVYADWLQSKGDPRGELIMVQHALGKKSPSEARDRIHAILQQHRAALLGPLGAEGNVRRTAGASARSPGNVDWEWRFGFLRTIWIGSGDGIPDFPAAVEAMLAHPSARFLEELTIGLAKHEGDNDYRPVIAALAKRPEALRRLRSLTLGDFDADQCEVSWSQMGDLSPLWPMLPRLERLRIHSGSMTLGALELPSLQSLAVETGGLDRAALRSILAAKLPKLSRLEIWFGNPDYGAECEAADLAPLLSAPPPGLVHLGLRNAIFTDELVELLHDSKALAQVRSLDLSLGCLTATGAGSLASHAARYRHLDLLDLSDNCLTDVTGLESLAKVVRLDHQRPDRIDEDRRYPSVGE